MQPHCQSRREGEKEGISPGHGEWGGLPSLWAWEWPTAVLSAPLPGALGPSESAWFIRGP